VPGYYHSVPSGTAAAAYFLQGNRFGLNTLAALSETLALPAPFERNKLAALGGPAPIGAFSYKNNDSSLMRGFLTRDILTIKITKRHQDSQWCFLLEQVKCSQRTGGSDVP